MSLRKYNKKGPKPKREILEDYYIDVLPIDNSRYKRNPKDKRKFHKGYLVHRVK